MEIKIFVENLGKHNEKEMVGDWITLPIDQDELNEFFAKIGLGYFDEDGNYVHGLEVDGVFYEEHIITDYEAPFEIHEYDSIERLNKIAEKMSKMTEEQVKVASALVDWGICGTIEEAFEEIENGNVTVYYEETMADVAYTFYEETGLIDWDNPLMQFIDWESVGDYLATSGTFINVEHGLWVEYHN